MKLPLHVIALCLLLAGCSSSEQKPLVVYTSQDQFYAEAVLRDFTKETGIEVQPVFDTESVKTAGLANRLRQESKHPRCDVFWSNEEMHARLLAADGVFPSSEVRAVGYRTRRLVINTNLMRLDDAPKSLLELTNEVWKGKVVLAYPLYGTTSSHFIALRQHWGAETWRRWCEGLVANRAKVVDGNSVVVRLVGAGEAAIGLTDSDDVVAGQRSSLPVAAAPFGPEMLVIPNTVNVVRPGQAAERFLEFISRTNTLDSLISAGALEGSEPPSSGLKLDWGAAPKDLREAEQILKEIFLRS